MPESETPETGAQPWSLRLPEFEGPLDLLLHLCQKHELDVLNIPVGFVTEKYLEFLEMMELMHLELAAEYLVMAATLVHIKSKMLLPTPPPEQEEDPEAEDAMDPREALIRRLLEYQKYKDAAGQLVSRSIAGRDVFGRGSPVAEAQSQGLPPLAEVPIFALLDAFQRVLDRSKVKLSHDVVADRISITDRISELSDLLSKRRRMGFEEIFDGIASKFDLVITFLALLEMARLKMTRLFQTEPLAPLFVELVTDDPPGPLPEGGPS